MSNSFDSVVFIKLPAQFRLSADAFQIDPSIPLPVQRQGGGPLVPDDLTAEMIFAGILAVLAHDRLNPHADYYRGLLLKARPNIKQELGAAAILKAKNEDFDLAEEIFAALRELDPDDIAIVLDTALMLDQRAESYRKSGLHDAADAADKGALLYYKNAMASEPALPDAFFNAGFFYLKKSLFDRARECFEAYLSLVDAAGAPDEKAAENVSYKRARAAEIISGIGVQHLDDEQFKAAHSLILSGKEQEGLEAVRRFLEQNPKAWNAWHVLGWGLRRLKRWEDARQAFRQAVACGGSNADTLNELAVCCMELGGYAESEQRLKDALAQEPDNAKLMTNMGFLLHKQGRIDAAQSWFRAALEFSPDNAPARQMTGGSGAGGSAG
jgi:Flp pilus assembly protein TadD